MSHILLSTVWHTGTTYFRLPLEASGHGVECHHCCPAVIEKAERGEYEILATTYRDPLRVAASWANRGNFGENGLKAWSEQWDAYHKLLEFNPLVFDVSKGSKQHGFTFGDEPLNSFKDELGLHAALDRGDMEYFYSHVPESLLVGLH